MLQRTISVPGRERPQTKPEALAELAKCSLAFLAAYTAWLEAEVEDGELAAALEEESNTYLWAGAVGAAASNVHDAEGRDDAKA